MRTNLLPFAIVLALSANAQSSNWDVHPLNMVPCTEWIYPADGCGGCGSCRMAVDTHPNIMDGGGLGWSNDLIMCPHPIDTQGNNVVVITNWPTEANMNSYLFGQVFFHEPMQIDTLEVICARANGGPDSIEVAIQFNTVDPQQTTTLLNAVITDQFATYTITDPGCVPMLPIGSGFANVYLRAHGGDLGLYFRGLRVVASPCISASVVELHSEEAVIRAVDDDVQITTTKPTDVLICDALGRVSFSKSNVVGTVNAPLRDGLNIVRAGQLLKKIVR